MPVPRISPADLHQALDSPEGLRPLVLDARLKYPFEHSTVMLPGAVRPPASVDGLPREQPVVVYDSDPDELAASPVATRLIRAGYRVSVLAGGIAAWLAAGLPVVTKTAPQPSAPAGSLKG